jgi:hypothetical protein
MPLAAVLVGDIRHMDHAPELPLAEMPTDEHPHELGGVEVFRLGPAAAAVDLDGGGVDDEVLDALVSEVTMEPEAVAAGLVAGDHRRVLGQSEAMLGAADLEQDGAGVAGGGGAEPGLLAGSDGEGQLPGMTAQLEGQVEDGRGHRGRIARVGR